jgi:N-acyl-D-amino-acid deacylase
MSSHTGQADFIIRNANIIDGTGAAAIIGDIAITDERISAIGNLAELSAGLEIDAAGKVVAPGFIDVHTHDDRALLANPLMHCKISQGVTTVVAGNCGISLAPLQFNGRPPPPLDLIGEDGSVFFSGFADYLSALDNDPPALNALCQVGHSSLRVEAMDNLQRPATADEIKAMRARLEQALEAGAIGMSTGLYYPPANAAPTAEIIELARALHDAGAIHTTHMRDEAAHITDSLQETFQIGRDAAVPVVISHHKCTGIPNHGRSRETLPLIEQARQQQRIGLDAYPYIASSTVLSARRMSESSRVIVTWSRDYPECSGRDLADIAADWKMTQVEAAEKLVPAGAIYFSMDEEDLRRILAYPHTMIGSDGLPHDTHPHPRLWGTFPRVLGHYARDVGLFPLEEAVRKMTGLPAAQFGLHDRGVLKVDAYADLVLFDADTIIDRADWEQPTRPAAGIELVMVNGRVVWRDGEASGERPGKALRLQGLAPIQGA